MPATHENSTAFAPQPKLLVPILSRRANTHSPNAIVAQKLLPNTSRTFMRPATISIRPIPRRRVRRATMPLTRPINSVERRRDMSFLDAASARRGPAAPLVSYGTYNLHDKWALSHELPRLHFTPMRPMIILSGITHTRHADGQSADATRPIRTSARVFYEGDAYCHCQQHAVGRFFDGHSSWRCVAGAFSRCERISGRCIMIIFYTISSAVGRERVSCSYGIAAIDRPGLTCSARRALYDAAHAFAATPDTFSRDSLSPLIVPASRSVLPPLWLLENAYQQHKFPFILIMLSAGEDILPCFNSFYFTFLLL